MLQVSSIGLMFKRGFSAHPNLPGITHGFFEYMENGQRGLLREGSGLGMNSRVLLLPEAGFGLFIAANTRGDKQNTVLISMLLDRYFQQTKRVFDTQRLPDEELNQFSGSCRYVQYSRRTISKISMILAS